MYNRNRVITGKQKRIINYRNNQITFNRHGAGEDVPECSEVLTIEIDKEEEQVGKTAQEKLEEITGINAQVKKELEEVLLRNHKIYREQPGRITSYEHKFVVTDTTPYCTKGWPVPLRYQEAVCKEIKKMEECGVIERAASPSINPNVTVIKKDPSVRLCLDARHINAVTVPDYEGAIPINEVLANCGNIKVMSLSLIHI